MDVVCDINHEGQILGFSDRFEEWCIRTFGIKIDLDTNIISVIDNKHLKRIINRCSNSLDKSKHVDKSKHSDFLKLDKSKPTEKSNEKPNEKSKEKIKEKIKLVESCSYIITHSDDPAYILRVQVFRHGIIIHEMSDVVEYTKTLRHTLKNHLNIISGYVSLLSVENSDQEKCDRVLKEVTNMVTTIDKQINSVDILK